tara:strand:+ start:694 stop:1443 length:750 start_codon:yes stop_codon:yes gene_type:complete
MARPIKYTTADDLLDNCVIHNDCFVWPKSSTPMPMLGPASPMAVKFGTTSIMRILFSICRFVPAGKRLVHWCNDPQCVNPFHASESRTWRAKRAKLDNPNSLLPEQDATRDAAAPPDEVLAALRPRNSHYIKILMDSAVVAGYDLKGMNNKRSYAVPQKAQPNFADPDVPVLVMANMTAQRKDSYPSVEEFSFDDIEATLDDMVAKTPIQKSKKPEAQLVDSQDDSIFAAIRRRDEYLRAQQRKAEHEG